MSAAPILRINDLQKHFPITAGLMRKQVGLVKAVDNISLSINKGETFALVGESGSGKTTLVKTVLRFLEPTAGEAWFDGQPLHKLLPAQLKQVRRQVQMVHQDPTSSLNPRKRLKEIIEEPLIVYGIGTPAERLRRVQELIDLVELPQEFLWRYPHQLSGGQKQRVGIARALALNPKLVVLDEPTSALDVSVQAKIVSLLRQLQQEMGLTYLFITHDLALVRNFADRVGVMYLGNLVETAPVEELFSDPKHPYTRALLSTIPTVSESELAALPDRTPLRGEIPSPANVPSGCPFHPRCPQAMDHCRTTSVSLLSLGSDRAVRCHLYGSDSSDSQTASV